MNLQAEVEVHHIYKGTPYVTLFSPIHPDWDEPKREILWAGYMVAIPSIGDPIMGDEISGFEVSGVAWYFSEKTEDIMVSVYLKEV